VCGCLGLRQVCHADAIVIREGPFGEISSVE